MKYTDKQTAFALLPKRKRDSHKGDYGKAAILAGSIEYTGAAYLATLACLRSGAGYTTLYVPKGILPYYFLKAPEALLRPLSDGERAVFSEKTFKGLLNYDSIAYGMGMGVSLDVALGAKYLIQNFTGKLILDADGLNSLAFYGKENLKELFLQKKCDVLITPHAKEFSRLSGVCVEEIVANGQTYAENFARDCAINVLLKGATSVITNGRQTYLNSTGNSGQAKGGSGDVLSGVIAGLCAQGASAFDGGILGAYLTGKTAELIVSERGEYSMLASDIAENLSKAFLFVTENTDNGGGE